MKKIIAFLSIFILSISVLAQEVTFDRKNFKDDRAGLRKAQDHIKEADKHFEAYPFPSYNNALEGYLQAQEFNDKDSRINYNIGICYINTTQKFKALKYFQNAFRLNGANFPEIHYYLGRGHHLEMEWDQAIEHYEAYKRGLPKNATSEYADVNKKIHECRSGKRLVQNPVRVWIDNMGKNVNSQYPEYGMIMTADASEIFYTSRRPNTTGGGMDVFSDGYYEDVYTSNRYNSKDWTPATNIGPPINTKGHDAAVALSPDGSRMIIYIDDKGDGNLYESVREGDTWSKPKKFNKEINSKYHEASAWYTPDAKQLFFVSERPRSGKEPGDRDIFVATWDENKSDWGNVERLPDNINSPYDEDGIYVHPDGKTLYFSSKGHNSMGGYDVFKTVKQDDGTWSNPENLGYPINTPDDDVFFVVAANGRDAYMTSYREEGFGDKDLYKVTMLGAKKDPIMSGDDMLLANSETPTRSAHIEPQVEVGGQVLILKGIVRDDVTKKPVGAEIELVDNTTNEVVASFTSDPKSGRYLVALPGGRNYGIAVKADKYLFHSENFDVKADGGYKEVEKNIDLKKIDIGKSIVLRNIFFDFDKYSLRDESQTELNRLTQLMKENPTLKIEISGHTDSRGSASYNKNLSKNRAKSVVDYLIAKGISGDRMTYEGYGLEKPMISNAEIAKMPRATDREDAHQMNRRTEFKIISM